MSDQNTKHNLTKEKGFTLIEVALAIAILGLGLSTLVALSTRLVDDTLHEINRTYASIISDYLLEVHLVENSNNTQINTQVQNPDPNNPNQTQQTGDTQTLNPGTRNSSGSVMQKLSNYGYFNGINKESETTYLNNAWTYKIQHEPLTLPLTKDQFEMITSTVSWGKSASDSVSIGIMVKIEQNAR